MPISDIPILTMLRTRMQWHQERQRVLAENVANADTPNYRARDLAPPDSATLCGRLLSIFRAPTPATSPETAPPTRNSPRTATTAMRCVRAATQ